MDIRGISNWNRFPLFKGTFSITANFIIKLFAVDNFCEISLSKWLLRGTSTVISEEISWESGMSLIEQKGLAAFSHVFGLQDFSYIPYRYIIPEYIA